ncbi:MAG: hypothetical protein KDA89_17610, partial [Planctomycetaceae bacterium]|nr:hypothetical protein [Planctomycetaceae bacterium]
AAVVLYQRPDQATEESAAILATAAGFLTFLSMLQHARFVIHIDNAPPMGRSRSEPTPNRSTVPLQQTAGDQPPSDTVASPTPQRPTPATTRSRRSA